MSSPRLRLLTIAWAIALLTTLNSSLVSYSGAFYPCTATATGLSALVLLVLPSQGVLLLSAALLLLLVGDQLPAVPNHRIVLAFIAATIMLSSIRSTLWTKKTTTRSDTDSEAQGVATLRWLTIILYSAASLAKLNYSYLNPETSCARRFLGESLLLHGLSHPETIATLVIWWSILGELAIALLLIPKRTRVFGIFFGVLFHLALATDYLTFFSNFSGAMYVLLFAWLSESAATSLWERGERLWRTLIPTVGFLLAGILVAALSGLLEPAVWAALRYPVSMVFGLTSAVLLLPQALSSIRRSPSPSHYRFPPPFWVLIAAALLNAASPYLGIKTRSSFSMYSNLRIDHTASNHLLMPASADIFGYLGDSVTIISSSDEEFLKNAPPGDKELPYISLCTYLARMDGTPSSPTPKTTVTFRRHGIEVTASQGDPLPKDCPPWIARKLLLFGAVGPGSDLECRW
jgi:hypothetical protein